MSKSNDTLNKAYGNIPKEPTPYVIMDFLPSIRGVKYYYHKLIRYFTR